jgi:hypothetical protein
MIWGMSGSTFTLVHVLVSLVGIGTGLAVMAGLLVGRALRVWTGLFLFTTVAAMIGLERVGGHVAEAAEAAGER